MTDDMKQGVLSWETDDDCRHTGIILSAESSEKCGLDTSRLKTIQGENVLESPVVHENDDDTYD